MFIPEAIPGSVTRALSRLQGCLSSNDETCVAWGNTNLTVAHYSNVLLMAEALGRPVRFIRWFVVSRIGLFDQPMI